MEQLTNSDEDALDLTPTVTTDSPRSARSFLVVGGVVVVASLIGYVLLQGLTNATTYFYDVDEAIEKRDEIGDRRVNLQGNVLDGSVIDTGPGVQFTMAFGGKSIVVEHTGNVPDLFSPKIPVVVEGTFSGDVFKSDDVKVRHDENYVEDNKERIKEAEDDIEKSLGIEKLGGEFSILTQHESSVSTSA